MDSGTTPAGNIADNLVAWHRVATARHGCSNPFQAHYSDGIAGLYFAGEVGSTSRTSGSGACCVSAMRLTKRPIGIIPTANAHIEVIQGFDMEVLNKCCQIYLANAKRLNSFSTMSLPCSRFCSRSCCLNHCLILARVRGDLTMPRLGFNQSRLGPPRLAVKISTWSPVFS